MLQGLQEVIWEESIPGRVRETRELTVEQWSALWTVVRAAGFAVSVNGDGFGFRFDLSVHEVTISAPLLVRVAWGHMPFDHGGSYDERFDRAWALCEPHFNTHANLEHLRTLGIRAPEGPEHYRY